MATDIPHIPTDVELLHDYLAQRLDQDGREISLDEALAGFQEYHRQLHALRSKVRQAEESLAHGAGRPLDVDAVISRVRIRLSKQGVVD